MEAGGAATIVVAGGFLAGSPTIFLAAALQISAAVFMLEQFYPDQ